AFRSVREGEGVISRSVREQHAIVAGGLRCQNVTENDVREFMREHSREAGLVGKDVNQTTADDDGVAHAERFQRCGKQHTRANRAGQINVVGNFKVVDDSLKNVVDVALKSEQARRGQALDNVVFRLLLPYTLGLQRRSILRRGAAVLHGVDSDVGQLVVLATLLQ